MFGFICIIILFRSGGEVEDYSNCGLFEGGFSVHLNTISNFFVLLYSVHYTHTHQYMLY